MYTGTMLVLSFTSECYCHVGIYSYMTIGLHMVRLSTYPSPKQKGWAQKQLKIARY